MDPAHISRLKEEQEQAFQETQAKIQQWNKFDADYCALQDRLKTLPDKVTHSVMVPFGTLAFMPGELIHTNEIMVLLGDNWFAERSAKQAREIVDRRKKEIQTTLSQLEGQKRLLGDRLGFTSEFKDLSENKGDIVEIKEDYDPEKEKLWREERQRKKKDPGKLKRSTEPAQHTQPKIDVAQPTKPKTQPAQHAQPNTEPNQPSQPKTETVKQRKEQTKQDNLVKHEVSPLSQVANTNFGQTKVSNVKDTKNEDGDKREDKKRQRKAEEALWARLDELERQEEELDELARLSDYDGDEDEYDNPPMFSYINDGLENDPSTQPQKQHLTRSNSADKKVKWKDQQHQDSSSVSSDDEMPRPAVIHFTHTESDIQQKPKPSESHELTSPADIYQHYLAQHPSDTSLSSGEHSDKATSPHQIKSIMKPRRPPEPAPEKPAKEILPQLDTVFSGTIVETKDVPMVTPTDNRPMSDLPIKQGSRFKESRATPISSQPMTEEPVKRVSKFKASRVTLPDNQPVTEEPVKRVSKFKASRVTMPNNQPVTEEPVKRVSKFKACRQQKR